MASTTATPSTTSSNAPHHSALLGIVLTAFGFISSPFVLHFLPEKYAALIGAVGAALAAFGLTGQIKQNTDATAASTQAVVTAVTTSAPVNMAPNPSIVAAGAARSSPMQGGGLPR
jgi:hypothetical protein